MLNAVTKLLKLVVAATLVVMVPPFVWSVTTKLLNPTLLNGCGTKLLLITKPLVSTSSILETYKLPVITVTLGALS